MREDDEHGAWKFVDGGGNDQWSPTVFHERTIKTSTNFEAQIPPISSYTPSIKSEPKIL